MKFYFYLIILNFVFTYSYGYASNDVLLSSDGNLLFYNAPSYAEFNGNKYFAYITKNGHVLVQTTTGELILVHDYTNVIIKELGKADDHAAPSLIYDKINDRLILATAYHGTSMHLYELKRGSKKFNKLKEIPGAYTYPQLIIFSEEVLLLSRLQATKNSGDLVIRRAMDNFNSENIILQAKNGHVIYAGVPELTSSGILINYSIHSYKENRLIGWYTIKYDPLNAYVLSSCDFQAFLGTDYHSNRPTGIRQKDGQVMIGTSYFDKYNDSLPEYNYNKRNSVIIIIGEDLDCSTFKIQHENIVRAPYYHTDITISKNLDYFYFDKDQFNSNLVIKDCFHHERMLYPNFINEGILYAAMNPNSHYEIRNFNNSLYFCHFES